MYGFKSLFEDTFLVHMKERDRGKKKSNIKNVLLKLFVGCLKLKLGTYQDVFLISEELLIQLK